MADVDGPPITFMLDQYPADIPGARRHDRVTDFSFAAPEVDPGMEVIWTQLTESSCDHGRVQDRRAQGLSDQCLSHSGQNQEDDVEDAVHTDTKIPSLMDRIARGSVREGPCSPPGVAEILCGEPIQEVNPGHRFGTETDQVPGSLLAVDQMNPPGRHDLDSLDESIFGGIGSPGKHAFPEEDASQAYPVETTHQVLVVSYLDALCKAELMEQGIRIDHVGGNPGAGLLSSQGRGSASPDDLIKGLVHGYMKGLTPEQGSHAVTHLESIRKENIPWVGTPPHGWFAGVEPGKYAVLVGQEEPFRTKVTTDGQQALWFGKPGVGKKQALIKAVYGHVIRKIGFSRIW